MSQKQTVWYSSLMCVILFCSQIVMTTKTTFSNIPNQKPKTLLSPHEKTSDPPKRPPPHGPILGGSLTIFMVRLTAGFFDSGSLYLTPWYNAVNAPIAPNHVKKASVDPTCCASKSRANSGATPSSHTTSFCSMSCIPTTRERPNEF